MILHITIGALVGGGLGFAYYRFVGCSSGTCPITSNPYISTAYGTMMGLFVPVQKKKLENLAGTDSR